MRRHISCGLRPNPGYQGARYAGTVTADRAPVTAVPGSAYGLIQGVTRYIDHDRGKDNAKRLNSAWFGQGENIKKRAVLKPWPSLRKRAKGNLCRGC